MTELDILLDHTILSRCIYVYIREGFGMDTEHHEGISKMRRELPHG